MGGGFTDFEHFLEAQEGQQQEDVQGRKHLPIVEPWKRLFRALEQQEIHFLLEP